MPGVQDRVALVTGAAQGIGAAVAAPARRRRREGRRARPAAGRRAGRRRRDHRGRRHRASALGADVSKRDQVQAAVDTLVGEFGGLHILVNNAGVLRDNLLFKMTDDDWTLVMEVHLRGAFLCSQIAQKHMVEAKYGRIVCMSSTSALGNRGQANYSTAKAGLQGLTKTLAIELGPFGVTANAIAPGLHRDRDDQGDGRAHRHRPSSRCARRSPRPSRCAAAACPTTSPTRSRFFAGEEAGYVTGQVIYVDGGRGLL